MNDIYKQFSGMLGQPYGREAEAANRLYEIRLRFAEVVVRRIDEARAAGKHTKAYNLMRGLHRGIYG